MPRTAITGLRREAGGSPHTLYLEGPTILGWDLDLEVSATWDGRGGLALPAFTDPHVHLRDPGQPHKETLRSGLAAAAAGGYGTVVSMPNTLPATDQPEAVLSLRVRADALGLCRLIPAAALTLGQEVRVLSDASLLAEAGAALLTDDGRTNEDGGLLRYGLQAAKAAGLLVAVHAEDASLRRGGVMHEGQVSERLGLPGNPAAAETARIARDLEICALTGARLHLQHLSAARSVELVRAAKRAGLPVTCEVTPHHLTLTDTSLLQLDAVYKVAPPLRTEADRQALLAGLRDGTIDCLASDHAPHSPAEKEQDLLAAPFGIANLELVFPLLYSELVLKGAASLEQLTGWLTSGPRKVLGLPECTLEAGQPADLVVMDLASERPVDPERLRTQAKLGPWNGRQLRGWPALTLYQGRVVHG